MRSLASLGLILALLTAVGWGFASGGWAGGGKSIEQMIAEAKTPADHEAIAAFYEEQARLVRQRQMQHERMRDSYAGRYPTKKTVMVTHCNQIIKRHQEMAQDYEALAKLHREMAQAAP